MRSSGILLTLATTILPLAGCEDTGRKTVAEPNLKAQAEEEDPFSPDYIPSKPQGSSQVKITTKFVQITSGTEELAFDWIVAPFSLNTPSLEEAEKQSSTDH
ncbi:MAG: hypothetical protein IZT59_06415 [Verrucomicrobia bacterium]|jgi:hypothetical protein|nr:hypothetical protein [Verrucomicrobiota bacterium]|tara:strand:- start:1773 stop:2078 length:306 start_codon:yes stop_codon:yes gene_type:complete